MCWNVHGAPGAGGIVLVCGSTLKFRKFRSCRPGFQALKFLQMSHHGIAFVAPSHPKPALAQGGSSCSVLCLQLHRPHLIFPCSPCDLELAIYHAPLFDFAPELTKKHFVGRNKANILMQRISIKNLLLSHLASQPVQFWVDDTLLCFLSLFFNHSHKIHHCSIKNVPSDNMHFQE